MYQEREGGVLRQEDQGKYQRVRQQALGKALEGGVLRKEDEAKYKRLGRAKELADRRKMNRPTWGEADAINTGRAATQEEQRRAKAVEPARKPVSALGRIVKAVSGAADAVIRMPKPSIISDDPERGGITGSLPPRRQRTPTLRARATTEDQLAREKDVRADAYDELGIVRASVAKRRPAKTDGTAPAAP